MNRYEGVDIRRLIDLYRNPLLGSPSSLSPGSDIPNVTTAQVEEWRKEARRSLVQRGFDDEQLKVFRKGGPEAQAIVTEYLAGGGSRYGTNG